MKKIILTLLIASTLLATGCSQIGAKSFGGDYDVELPQGEKLINITWKDDTIWYLTEPMEEGYEPKEYKFQADSVFGVFEGTVTVKENE